MALFSIAYYTAREAVQFRGPSFTLGKSKYAVPLPDGIRKAIYTTNAIESLNSFIHKTVKKRKLFPTDDVAKKVVYLVISDASKCWSMPIRNGKQALNWFVIEFEDRLSDYQ